MKETHVAPKLFPFPRRKAQWPNYVRLGVLINAAIWSLVLLYLKFMPHSYTSKWGLSILGAEPGIEVYLPDGSRAAPYPVAEKPRAVQDPRLTYAYIATSPDILKKAAKEVDMSVKDFGKPKVKTDEYSAVISFEMKGKTPTEAQLKSQVLYQVMHQHVKFLRKAELELREQELEEMLQDARAKLNSAENKLFYFNNSSALSSDEQIKELAANIEQLRRRDTELLAQKQGLNQKFQRLSTDLNLSYSETISTYRLLANDLFNKQIGKYSKARTDLTSLLSRFTPENQSVIAKQNEVEEAAAALEKQASLILGRPVSKQLLLNLQANIFSQGSEAPFKDLVTSQANLQELTKEQKKIEERILQSQSRLKRLAKEQLSLDILKRDLRMAEVVFTSTVAKLNIGKGDIDSIYPSIQLVSGPSLPESDEPTVPNKQFAFLGGGAASFLATTGLALLWFDRRNSFSE